MQQLAAKTTYILKLFDQIHSLLRKDGNFLQDLLIEEGVAAVDALSRAAVLELQVDEKHQFNANGKILPCLLVSMTPCSMSSIDIVTPSGHLL